MIGTKWTQSRDTKLGLISISIEEKISDGAKYYTVNVIYHLLNRQFTTSEQEERSAYFLGYGAKQAVCDAFAMYSLKEDGSYKRTVKTKNGDAVTTHTQDEVIKLAQSYFDNFVLPSQAMVAKPISKDRIASMLSKLSIEDRTALLAEYTRKE